MTNEKEIIGGSAYGASYVAGGQGSLPVTESFVLSFILFCLSLLLLSALSHARSTNDLTNPPFPCLSRRFLPLSRTNSDKKTGLYQGKSFAGIVNAYVKGSQL
jgi:hypothetical protein